MYGGYPFAGKGTSSYLIQAKGFNLLLDCGSGALMSLEKYIDPLKLDAVLLSHYHNDHIADIGVLQYYWQLNNQEVGDKILPIYGHDEDKNHFDELTWARATVGIAYNPNEVLNIGPFNISFLKTKHPVVTYAIRIEDLLEKKVITYTADTAEIQQMVAFAQGSDLLITDTNYSADKEGTKWHMTSTESAKLAVNSVSKKLMLSHLPQKIAATSLVEEAKLITKNKVEVFSAFVGLSEKV